MNVNAPAPDVDELLNQYHPDDLLIALDRADCADSFVTFIRAAWPQVEPGQPYVHNWHIDFICAHLQAITEGVMIDEEEYYNRLLINVPPGMMKSLLVNVFWPSWEWGPKNMPSMRYVCASHSLDLAIRDSTKMRRLIQSEWYQKRWGDRVQLTGDQNAKVKFENTATGFRQAIAAGSITGARGDRVIIDDPHSVESAASEQQRATTIDWFERAVPTRLNNPDRSAIIVIMQRLHEEDVSGIILEKELGYDHIMLPMEFDPSRTAPTLLDWEDPRTDVGELMFPERFPAHSVARDKKVMGPYAVSGQLQQIPTPSDGGIIKRDWWQVWPPEGSDESEKDTYPVFDYIVAYLDTAYTEKTENDPSAITFWGVFSDDPIAKATRVLARDNRPYNIERTYTASHPKVMLAYAWQDRLALHPLVEKVHSMMKIMKADCLLIENKAAGHSVAQELARLYRNKGYMVILDDPKDRDKISRLYSVQHLFAEELIYAPNKVWADMVINQVMVFPKGKNDDLVDTTSGALSYLRRTGMIERAEEAQMALNDSLLFKGKPPAPLYPS